MYNSDVEYRSFITSNDLSSCIWHAVDLVGDNTIGLGAANGGMGILANKPRNAEQAQVAVKGQVQVRAGLAISAGGYVTSAGSGWVITVSSTTTASQLGRVVVGCASGMIGVVELNPVKAPTV